MAMSLHEIAQYVAEYNDVPIGIVQAQLSHESAHGTSELARDYHNYGGIKDWESEGDEYRNFGSDEDFADYYAKYLSKYDVRGVRDPRTFVHILKEGGYFEDDEETYASSVEGIYNSLGEDSPVEDDLVYALDPNVISVNNPDQNVTNTERMLPESILGANLIGQWAQANKLSAVLTGGAEHGYHEGGEFSHEAGWKGDFVIDGAEGGTSKGEALIAFAHENGWSINWEKDHWDIDFSGNDKRDPQDGSVLRGNGGNSLLGGMVTSGLQGPMADSWLRFFPQQDPEHHEYKPPSVLSLMGKNFWDEWSQTGFGSMATFMYGSLVSSDQPFWGHVTEQYRVTDEDVKMVKEALPDDKEAQNYILMNAQSKSNMLYLIEKKRTEKKRAEELERWRVSSAYSLQDWMVRLAGGAGVMLDPLNFIPMGEAVAAVKMGTRLKGAITNIAKAKAVARYAAEMGLRQVGANAVDDILRDTFSDQKPDYAMNAAMAFAGGAVSGALGGLAKWHSLSAGSRKVVKTAEKIETDNLRKSADSFTPEELTKIRNESYSEALKLQDKKWAKKAKKTSKAFAYLDEKKRVLALKREDATSLMSRMTGKDLPADVNAFYVPNEDYMVIISDSKKAMGDIDKLLAHESMHGSIRDYLGETRYKKTLKGILKDYEAGKETIVKAAQKAGTTDPEEILGQLIEDGTLYKEYSDSIVGKLQKEMNRRLRKYGFSKNTLSKDDVMEIIQSDLKKDRREPLGGIIHLNEDGSTVYAGIKFSRDNVMNPQNLADAMAYEAPIVIKERPSKMKRFFTNFGPLKTYYSDAVSSVSPEIRKYAPAIFKDASGGNKINKMQNAMCMEAQKQRITNMLNIHHADLMDARKKFIGKFKNLYSNEAKQTYNEMVVRVANALDAGNIAGFTVGEVPPEVMEGVNAIRKLRSEILRIGKESSKMVGSTYDNMVDDAWYAVDNELWRAIDQDKWHEFTNMFVTNNTRTKEQQIKSVLSRYIDTYAKRDVIKERIVRDSKVRLSKMDKDKITEEFLKKNPVKVEDISDAMAESWLQKHKKGAIEEWLRGGREMLLEKSNPEVGHISPFQSRIPLDTSGVIQFEYGGKMVDFSFDGIRKYDLDSTISGNINRFAGEASMKATFGDEKHFKRMLAKAKRELQTAVDNHVLNKGDAEDVYNNFVKGIYEIRGLKDSNAQDSVGALEGFVHLMRGLAYMKNGANMGWNQLGEMGGSLAYGGAARLFDLFPPLARFVERMRYGDAFAKELSEDLIHNVFGDDLMSDIFSRSYKDTYMAKNFSRRGGIGGTTDLMARFSGDMVNFGSRMTSAMNMLPWSTDFMVKGMQKQLVTDSIRMANGKWTQFMTLRNPFSTKKLASAGVSAKDWEVIKAGIKKYTKLSKTGEIISLDWRKWQDANPVAFSQWYNLIQQGTERAIIDSASVGNKSIMKNASPLTQLLFQFKDFSLRSYHGQTLRALEAHELDDALATGLGIITNVASYAARGLALAGAYEAVGMKEKAKEVKDRMLSTENLARAAATRSAIVGTPLSFANDYYESLFNTYSLRTTVDQSMNTEKKGQGTMMSSPTDIAGRITTQLPAVKEALNPLWAVYTYNQQGGITEKTMKRMLQTLPIQNWIPFTVMQEKLLKDMDLPKTKKKKGKRHGGY
ncbi:MAG: glucosaminidase domain-containing protein [Acidaminococcus intestini]|uniref:Glucosaminidase domain-containing protein n=1 Tax=Acidaminococcus intestini TaxID=187327 RepID=A0A943EGA6_9FIRM|nr:glucosaminidase domain-containing protein [Acidaminococcus intestini]